jgi:D-3-phosphoglycerate dehydrogenase
MHTSFPKEKIKVLLLENISVNTVEAFHESGYTDVTLLKGALSEEELNYRLPDVHILGIRSKTTLTEKALRSAPKLLTVGCFCIGTNQVDKKAATALGIPVFNSPYSNTRSVAELVIGAAVMLIRRIPEKNEAAHRGIWMKDATASRELRGKTLGIVGYGAIGSQVSVLAEALGMRVIYYDIEKKLPLGNAQSASSLEAVLEAADLVTLHVPSTELTAGMIHAGTLAHCKPGTLLINYARGEVVDMGALRDALQNGLLGGAALDVFPEEPERNGDAFHVPVQGLPNVLLTPHVGGSTEEAQVAIGEDVSTKLIGFIERGATQGSHTVPQLSLPPQEGAHRILHIHRNVPGVLSQINGALSSQGINILGQYLKTNEHIGYVVLDVDQQVSGDAVKLLRDAEATIRVRVVY